MSEPPPIERAFFRRAEDGATVFFPWGLGQRGYRLAEPGSKQKASRAASLLVGATIALGTWTAHRLQPWLDSDAAGAAELLGALALPGAALGLVIVGYALWVSRFVENLQESDLRVSREARLREAAELADPRKIALIGAILGGLSALLVWLQPRAWWLGLLGIALGAGVVGWSVLLRRAARGRSL